MDCFEDEGGGVVWPDPLRALFMLYEQLSRVVAEQLGPDDAADYLAAAGCGCVRRSCRRGAAARSVSLRLGRRCARSSRLW